MGRLGRIVAAVVLAGIFGLAAAVNPPEAAAYYGPNPVTLPANWTATYNLATGVATRAAGSAAAEAAVTEAMVSSTMLTGPVLALGATALGVGVLIGGGVNKWFNISCRISSTCTASTTDFGLEFRYWEWNPGSLPTGYFYARSYGVPPNSYSYFMAYAGEFNNWPGPPYTDPMVERVESWYPTTGLPGTLVTLPDGSRAFRATLSEVAATAIATNPETYGSQPYSATVTPPADPGSDSAIAADVRASLLSGPPAADLEVGRMVDPAWQGETAPSFVMPDCAGLTAASCLAQLQAAGWVGTSSTNVLGIDDAVLALGGGLVTTTNPAAGVGSVGISDPVTFNVNPDPLPLELSAQLANETAADYLTRIGYVGTVTYVDLPVETSDPALGPGAPVRVTAPAPAGGTRTIPVPAPGGSASPQRVPNQSTTSVTVARNSPSMPPVAAGSGSCAPWLQASLDLTPLTGLNLGDKFPFGLFVWADGVLRDLSVTAAAPSWAFGMPSLAGRTMPSFDINLAWLDPYMSVLRSILSWLLWVGAVWFLATALLGLRVGGDPSEAMDDVL